MICQMFSRYSLASPPKSSTCHWLKTQHCQWIGSMLLQTGGKACRSRQRLMGIVVILLAMALAQSASILTNATPLTTSFRNICRSFSSTCGLLIASICISPTSLVTAIGRCARFSVTLHTLKQCRRRSKSSGISSTPISSHNFRTILSCSPVSSTSRLMT